MKTHWLSRKEKAPVTAVSKEGHADSLLGHERTYHFDVLEKGATVNIASYCQLVWQNSPNLLNDPHTLQGI